MQPDSREIFRTPRTDAAERFFYESGRPTVGFVDSVVARTLELELARALAQLKAHGLEAPLPPNPGLLQASAPPRRAHKSLFQASQADAVAAVPAAPQRARTPALPAVALTEAVGELGVYEDGQVLYRRGERADHVFIVLQGQVWISDTEDGSTERALDPGQVLGEFGMFEEGLHVESVQAQGKVRCVRLSTAKLRSLVPADGSLLHIAMMALVLQYRMVSRLAASLAGGQLPPRDELLGQKTLTGPELHRALVEARSQAPGQGMSTSQRMCLQLQTAELMPTRLLRADTDLGRPGLEHLGLGLMTVNGMAQLRRGEQAVQLGQGSVIGVAEGLTGMDFAWSYAALEDINARVFPIDRALQRFERADPLVQALASHLCERILALQARSPA